MPDRFLEADISALQELVAVDSDEEISILIFFGCASAESRGANRVECFSSLALLLDMVEDNGILKFVVVLWRVFGVGKVGSLAFLS